MLSAQGFQRIANFTRRTNIRKENGYGNARGRCRGGKLGGQAQLSGVCKDLTASVNSMARNIAWSSHATCQPPPEL